MAEWWSIFWYDWWFAGWIVITIILLLIMAYAGVLEDEKKEQRLLDIEARLRADESRRELER
jgi:hypothetical protein